MTGFSPLLQKRLESLKSNSLYRKLSDRIGLDFSSNDYLGFSHDPVLKTCILDLLRDRMVGKMDRLPLGASGSRLLRGQLRIFEEAEETLANFCGHESALIFSTGYQANLGLLSALLSHQDIVFSDQNNHASIIDGIRLSGAKKKIYSHLNMKHLRTLLEAEFSKQESLNVLRVIVTESLFSMDGDQAPLVELSELAEEFSALLIVDEAHATGLWGQFSSGRSDLGGGMVQSLGLSQRVFATVHPAGKAMGIGGAWVCGSRQLKEYLVNFSRSFIFSTAPVPILPVMLQASVGHWKEVGKLRAQEVLNKAHKLYEDLTKVSSQLNGFIRVPEVCGPILPVIMGSSSESLKLAGWLQESGFDVRSIRPPTVPEGTSRLRVTVNWWQSPEEINRFVETINHYGFKEFK